MKKIKNDFRVLVEFREIGQGVSCAILTPSMKFEVCDFRVFADLVLNRLLPAGISTLPLYDGSILLVSGVEDALLDYHSCPDCVSKILPSFDINMELPDGSFRSVEFCLVQSDSSRRDYTFRGSRFLDLRGYFLFEPIEESEDEAPED